ncbi:hypothetical protein D9756_006875 [Leucocoprinus leucothites]|uniref:Uncharacterized protein n=1 Tax=Leucocoprinus leucothites TaxID=201217 RepID=A0A8H5G2M3_9AGAR|nr:hypothetical protein D9756_006875 [Leucoagaricus leucothites]
MTSTSVPTSTDIATTSTLHDVIDRDISRHSYSAQTGKNLNLTLSKHTSTEHSALQESCTDLPNTRPSLLSPLAPDNLDHQSLQQNPLPNPVRYTWLHLVAREVMFLGGLVASYQAKDEMQAKARDRQLQRMVEPERLVDEYKPTLTSPFLITNGPLLHPPPNLLPRPPLLLLISPSCRGHSFGGLWTHPHLSRIDKDLWRFFDLCGEIALARTPPSNTHVSRVADS